MKKKRVPALVMLFKSKLLSKISERKTCLNSKSNDLIDVQRMEEIKNLIIRMVQRRSSGADVRTIEKQWKKLID